MWYETQNYFRFSIKKNVKLERWDTFVDVKRLIGSLF